MIRMPQGLALVLLASSLAVQGCASAPRANADTTAPENQHEIWCGGSGCFNEATRVCFDRHGTTGYHVVGQRPAGGGLIILCDLPEEEVVRATDAR